MIWRILVPNQLNRKFMQNNLILLPGKERSPMRHHPWIFAGAVAKVEGKPASGSTVWVYSDSGQFIGRAAYSPDSQIRARIWSWDEGEPIDHAFFKRKIATAIAHRLKWVKNTTATRLIFGEADGLPGLVVDQYGDVLVCQFMSAGVEHWKDAIVSTLAQQTGAKTILERSDAAVREREGLPQITGALLGEIPDGPIVAEENGIKYLVDTMHGHKTGFYIDQRDSRALVGELSKDRRVLNMFCYTGGFSLAAMGGGASEVVSVDSSGDALAIAKAQVALNGFDESKATWEDADAFEMLRKYRVEGRKFDLIVLDPPKFAPSAHHLARAKKAYKDINRTAMQLLEPGGLLFTFSCSGAMDATLFEETVAAAAIEATSHMGDPRIAFRILRRLSSGLDHPKLASFPEGDYLKGLLLERV